MTRARMLALFIIVGAIGCASAGTPGPARANPAIITQEEIAHAGTGNAYDVIHRLRPNFLVSRGEVTLGNVQTTQTNTPYPNVYLDGLAYGDINSLRNIDSSQLIEVRMYQAWEAQTKFGLGNNAGVIAISTHK
jgi:hypothetical protein